MELGTVEPIDLVVLGAVLTLAAAAGILRAFIGVLIVGIGVLATGLIWAVVTGT